MHPEDHCRAHLSAMQQRLSANTVRLYTRHLGDLNAFLSARGVEPSEAAAEDLHAFMDARGGEGSLATQVIAAVGGFYRWLVLAGHRADDPSSALRRPAAGHSPASEERLDDIDADFLANQPWPGDDRDRAVVLAFLDGGLKVEELVALRWTEVDWGQRSIRVGLGGRTRVVPCEGRWFRALRALHAGSDRESPFILPSRATTSALTIRAVFDVVRRVGAAVGLDELSPKTLRLTCLHRLHQDGLTHVEIAERMGYAHYNSVRIALGQMAAVTRSCATCKGRGAPGCGPCHGTGAIVEAPKGYVEGLDEGRVVKRLRACAAEVPLIADELRQRGSHTRLVTDLRTLAAEANRLAQDVARALGVPEATPPPPHAIEPRMIPPRLRAAGTEWRKLGDALARRQWIRPDLASRLTRAGVQATLAAREIRAGGP
jgi:site-specific recombinase XerD